MTATLADATTRHESEPVVPELLYVYGHDVQGLHVYRVRYPEQPALDGAPHTGRPAHEHYYVTKNAATELVPGRVRWSTDGDGKVNGCGTSTAYVRGDVVGDGVTADKAREAAHRTLRKRAADKAVRVQAQAAVGTITAEEFAALPTASPSVGERVAVHARGKLRTGVVERVARGSGRITVALVTRTSPDRITRVTAKPGDARRVAS